MIYVVRLDIEGNRKVTVVTNDAEVAEDKKNELLREGYDVEYWNGRKPICKFTPEFAKKGI